MKKLLFLVLLLQGNIVFAQDKETDEFIQKWIDSFKKDNQVKSSPKIVSGYQEVLKSTIQQDYGQFPQYVGFKKEADTKPEVVIPTTTIDPNYQLLLNRLVAPNVPIIYQTPIVRNNTTVINVVPQISGFQMNWQPSTQQPFQLAPTINSFTIIKDNGNGFYTVYPAGNKAPISIINPY